MKLFLVDCLNKVFIIQDANQLYVFFLFCFFLCYQLSTVRHWQLIQEVSCGWAAAGVILEHIATLLVPLVIVWMVRQRSRVLPVVTILQDIGTILYLAAKVQKKKNINFVDLVSI